VFILALAGYNFATYTVASSYQSTFNLQPGLVYALPVNVNPSDSIDGHFQESSGSTVSFYILTSVQYAAFQSQALFNYVYGPVSSPSSDVSYAFPAQDTYYLMFRHGSGLVNTTETVSFHRTYTTHVSLRLDLGLILLPLVVVDLAYAFLRRKPKLSEAPTQQ
jgi:hypothetical protein